MFVLCMQKTVGKMKNMLRVYFLWKWNCLSYLCNYTVMLSNESHSDHNNRGCMRKYPLGILYSVAAQCNICTFCPTSSFIAHQVPKRAILYARVRNLQILRGCYCAAEYVLLREHENSENRGGGMIVARDTNENVEVAWTNVLYGGGYFHHGNVTIAGCTLRLGCVIETSGYEGVIPDMRYVSICHG